jgi:RecA-family ATPase
MACSTLVLCMDCHLLHNILTRVSMLKKTNHCIHIEVKDTIDTQKSASYLFLHVEINYGGKIKNKILSHTQRHHFPKKSTPLSSVTIYQHHQRIEFTFLN